MIRIGHGVWVRYGFGQSCCRSNGCVAGFSLQFTVYCWSMTVTISVVAVLPDCDMIEDRIHSSVKLHRAK